MKSIKIIITVVLSLQVGVLLADNERIIPAMEFNSTISMVSLSPSTPSEATFEEVAVENTFLGLSPVTPDVASLEDFSIEMVSVKDFAPVLPVEADFTDTVEINLGQLAPVTPIEADFE